MATKEQLRRMREKYHLGEYSTKKKSSSRKATRRRSGFMVRHKKGHKRRGGMGGIMGMVKPIAVGTIGGLVAPKIPFLNTLPFSQAIGGAGACFLTGQKTIPKLAIGAASGQFISPVANNVIASATGYRIY